MALTIPEREAAGKRGPRHSGGRRVPSVDVDPCASSGAKHHGDTLVRGDFVPVRVLKLLGSDLEHGAGDGIVAVRIVHRPNACEECLIPDDMLGPMLTTAFRRAAPAVTGVRIEHVHGA